MPSIGTSDNRIFLPNAEQKLRIYWIFCFATDVDIWPCLLHELLFLSLSSSNHFSSSATKQCNKHSFSAVEEGVYTWQNPGWRFAVSARATPNDLALNHSHYFQAFRKHCVIFTSGSVLLSIHKDFCLHSYKTELYRVFGLLSSYSQRFGRYKHRLSSGAYTEIRISSFHFKFTRIACLIR